VNAKAYCMFFDNRSGLAGLSDEQWEAYLEDVGVPCITPAGLLAELRVAPGDVAYVLVDAEGSDQEIVGAFLDLPGFAPSMLMYEKSCYYTDCMDLMGRLSSLGYHVYQQRGDFVALLASDVSKGF